MKNNALIVIPARYGSTRFPGKPLTMIAGKTMLQRVYEIASQAIAKLSGVEVVIATDDQRIVDAANMLSANVVMTPVACKTGSDRALAAVKAYGKSVEYVVNLQGDAPLTPPHFVTQILTELMHNPHAQVTTPCVKLAWNELDQLRIRKQSNPFSGTTVTVDANNKALWFSKNIIPAIRNEPQLRNQQTCSPILGHIGLYAYQLSALQKFVTLKEGYYEQLEGLEQLRLLENNIPIYTVEVDYQGRPVMSGVDTEQDAQLAEQLILQYGEPCHA